MKKITKILNKTFRCYPLGTQFNEIAAIYVIANVDKNYQGKVLDVGQTGQLGTRMNSHDREECWKRNCSPKNEIWICYFPMPTKVYSIEDRLELERRIRHLYKPTCGEK